MPDGDGLASREECGAHPAAERPSGRRPHEADVAYDQHADRQLHLPAVSGAMNFASIANSSAAEIANRPPGMPRRQYGRSIALIAIFASASAYPTTA